MQGLKAELAFLILVYCKKKKILRGLEETKADFELYSNEPSPLCLCFLAMFSGYKT